MDGDDARWDNLVPWLERTLNHFIATRCASAVRTWYNDPVPFVRDQLSDIRQVRVGRKAKNGDNPVPSGKSYEELDIILESQQKKIYRDKRSALAALGAEGYFSDDVSDVERADGNAWEPLFRRKPVPEALAPLEKRTAKSRAKNAQRPRDAHSAAGTEEEDVRKVTAEEKCEAFRARLEVPDKLEDTPSEPTSQNAPTTLAAHTATSGKTMVFSYGGRGTTQSSVTVSNVTADMLCRDLIMKLVEGAAIPQDHHLDLTDAGPHFVFRAHYKRNGVSGLGDPELTRSPYEKLGSSFLDTSETVWVTHAYYHVSVYCEILPLPYLTSTIA